MLISLANFVISALQFLVFLDAILSWIPDLRYRYRELSRAIERITRPMTDPFRKLIPPSRTGGLDLSPLLAIVALGVVRQILNLILTRGITWQ